MGEELVSSNSDDVTSAYWVQSVHPFIFVTVNSKPPVTSCATDAPAQGREIYLARLTGC